MKRIVIIGAGLGGLACAAVLRRAGIEATVLERDPHAHARDQGGSLDLREESGQAALRVAGLFDGFVRLARTEGQEMREYRHTGELIEPDVQPGEPEYRPEIDRTALRDLLLGAVGESAVRWGTAVRSVTAAPGGGANLVVDGAAPQHVDLVVGADGAWSVVRPVVSSARPLYTGNILIEAWFDQVDARHPEVAALVGAGMLFASDAADPSRVLVVQRTGGDRVRAYIGLRCPRDWAARAGVDFADTAAVRRHLLSLFAGWDDRLRVFLRDNDGRFIERPIHRLPVPHQWPHVDGITLLGDAAHLMPPAGEGANLALLDGTELATAIARAVADGGDLDAAVAAYEAKMQARGARAAEAALRMLD